MVSTSGKTLVFGASGGVGQECVKQLIAKGQQVVAFVRSPEKLQGLLSDQTGLTICKGDVKDVASIKQCITE